MRIHRSAQYSLVLKNHPISMHNHHGGGFVRKDGHRDIREALMNSMNRSSDSKIAAIRDGEACPLLDEGNRRYG
jgi:hypothetical protein